MQTATQKSIATPSATAALCTVGIQSPLAGIGICYSGDLHHGSDVTHLASLKPEMRDTLGFDTLGPYIYFTDARDTAVNYAVRRARDRGGKPTIYTISVSDLYVADLSSPQNVTRLLPSLADHFELLTLSRPANRSNFLQAKLERSVLYLRHAAAAGFSFNNIREVFEGKHADEFGVPFKSMIHRIGPWLEKNGFQGLRCIEGGETTPGATTWKNSMTYAIFNPSFCAQPRETQLS